MVLGIWHTLLNPADLPGSDSAGLAPWAASVLGRTVVHVAFWAPLHSTCAQCTSALSSTDMNEVF